MKCCMFAVVIHVVSGCSDTSPARIDAAQGGSDIDAPPSSKRIFITSQMFQGNLGGLVGADAICTSQATQLAGSWKAWLSTTTVNAIDRIANVGPWYDTHGTQIFANHAALMSMPSVGLNYDAAGTFLGSHKIWTGTGFGGTYLAALSGSAPCSEWTSSAMNGQAKVGQVGRADVAWTAQSNTTCDQDAHLICIEQ